MIEKSCSDELREAKARKSKLIFRKNQVNYTTNVLVTVSTSPMIFEVGPVEHTPFGYIFTLC